MDSTESATFPPVVRPGIGAPTFRNARAVGMSVALVAIVVWAAAGSARATTTSPVTPGVAAPSALRVDPFSATPMAGWS